MYSTENKQEIVDAFVCSQQQPIFLDKESISNKPAKWQRLRLILEAVLLYPYTYHIGLILGVFTLLFWDTHITNIYLQSLLSIPVFVVLCFWTRFLGSPVALQVWVCTALAIILEVSSVWCGSYHYRLNNLPLFVIPAHGSVYLFAITLSSTPLMLKFGQLFCRITLIVGIVWSISAATWLPFYTHRLDITGLINLPVFIWLILRSSRAFFCTAMFFIVTLLEFVGTGLGNWEWARHFPYSGAPIGNPPALVAVGYFILDYATIFISSYLNKLLAHWRCTSSG